MSETIDSDETYASRSDDNECKKVNRVVVVLGHRHTSASIAHHFVP